MSIIHTPPTDHDEHESWPDSPPRGRTLVRGTPGRKRKRPYHDDLEYQHGIDMSTAATSIEPEKRRCIEPTPPQSISSRVGDRPPHWDTANAASRERTADLSPGRRSSPVRKQLNSLPTAVPSIIVKQGNITNHECQEAQDLQRKLAYAAFGARVPQAFREQLQQEDNIMLDAFSQDMPPELCTPELLCSVRYIYRTAAACAGYNKDENSWVRVVESVLKTVIYGQCLDWIEDDTQETWQVHSIQSQNIHSRFMLKTNVMSLQKKSDVAITYSPLSPAIRELRAEMIKQDVGMSHFSDAFTEFVPVGFLVEVKSQSGSMDEAELQIAVCAAAAIAYLDLLRPAEQDTPQEKPPVTLGWTVCGHDWKLWIAWQGEEKAVHVRGINLGSALGSIGTSGLGNIFALICVLRRAIQWLDEEYMPVYTRLARRSLGMEPQYE
ncbi:Hypothetical predicted protein [Lecanosticta acicola]|uniref:PD-(D/E)XK nuclease-like domain-containing protein n=1 Tax=Lecanosticta acicola TaxID=111012 RepID=A0AAI8YZ85_9PEZI|nr:Hypothetical predicted protein [Lecanosticta acicola]